MLGTLRTWINIARKGCSFGKENLLPLASLPPSLPPSLSLPLSHLTADEIFDKAGVSGGGLLLVGCHEGGVTDGNHRTREQPEDAQELVHTAEDLWTKQKVDEGNADHDVHLLPHVGQLLRLCGEF